MMTSRPKSLTIIAVLLVVLAIGSIASALTSLPLGLSGAGQQGALPGNPPSGGNIPNNNNNSQNRGNNFNPQGGANGFDPQAQGSSGNFQRQNIPGGTFSLNSILRTLGLGGQYMIYVNIGIAVIAVILALLCAFFVWKQKRWALNLAMALALLFLIGAVPALFTSGRFINWLRIGLNALSAAASLPILFMGVLPSVRDFVS